jgi:hypothetical protein
MLFWRLSSLAKTVVLMNAEIDATIGPILQVYAKKHGGILSATARTADELGFRRRWIFKMHPRTVSFLKVDAILACAITSSVHAP